MKPRRAMDWVKRSRAGRFVQGQIDNWGLDDAPPYTPRNHSGFMQALDRLSDILSESLQGPEWTALTVRFEGNVNAFRQEYQAFHPTPDRAVAIAYTLEDISNRLKREGISDPDIMRPLEEVGRGLHEQFGLEVSFLQQGIRGGRGR